MKKYKKIIVVALCFALLLSMFTFSTFAADDPAVSEAPVMPIDDEDIYIYYLPPDSVTGDFSLSDFSGMVSTFEYSQFACSSISFSGSSVVFDAGFEQVSISRSSDFLVVSLSPIPEFSDFFVNIFAFFSGASFTVPSGWSVSPGYSSAAFDFAGTVNGFPASRLVLGYDLSDVPTSDSLVSFSFESGSKLFTSSDSLQFTISAFSNIGFLYFLLHNGVVIESPPTILESILDVFLSIGQWISGAVNSIIPMFWNASDGTLTFVGILSVSALALSVVFLVLSLIEKFLRFGG